MFSDKLSSDISSKTGSPPAWKIELMVAIKVYDCVRTSSFFLRPADLSATQSAELPELVAKLNLDFVIFESLSSSKFIALP